MGNEHCFSLDQLTCLYLDPDFFFLKEEYIKAIRWGFPTLEFINKKSKIAQEHVK